MVNKNNVNESEAMKLESVTSFDDLDKQVICDLLDSGMIDGDLLIRVAQVMMLPEFKEFFVALCQIDLTDVDQSSVVLNQAAQTLARPV